MSAKLRGKGGGDGVAVRSAARSPRSGTRPPQERGLRGPRAPPPRKWGTCGPGPRGCRGLRAAHAHSGALPEAMPSDRPNTTEWKTSETKRTDTEAVRLRWDRLRSLSASVMLLTARRAMKVAPASVLASGNSVWRPSTSEASGIMWTRPPAMSTPPAKVLSAEVNAVCSEASERDHTNQIPATANPNIATAASSATVIGGSIALAPRGAQAGPPINARTPSQGNEPGICASRRCPVPPPPPGPVYAPCPPCASDVGHYEVRRRLGRHESLPRRP